MSCQQPSKKSYKRIVTKHMGTIKQRKIMRSLSNFQDTIVILQGKSNLQSHQYIKQQCRNSFISL